MFLRFSKGAYFRINKKKKLLVQYYLLKHKQYLHTINMIIETNELTWQELQIIYILVTRVQKELDCDPALWPEWAFGTEGIYTEVLRRFNEIKSKQQ